MTEYDGATQGPTTTIRPHDVDEAGNEIAPGHRCKLLQGDNEMLMDRTLLETVRQFMDAEAMHSSPGFER